MSFILDAIRKSESERQKSRQPDSHSFQNEGGYRSEARSSFWRIASLLVALVLLLIIFAWLWPKLSAQFGVGQLDQLGKLGEAVSKPDTDSQQAAIAPSNAVPANSAAESSTMQSSPNGSQHDPDTLPPRHQIKELWELPVDYQALVPDMEFTWHTFGLEPNLRSVEINGRMLKEGDRVAAGLQLRVIDSTGVIMHYRDRYFFIDVQEKLSQ